MVFVTIFSKPQLNAMVAKLEKEAVENWGRQLTPPTGRSAWEIVDLGDIVVHVLSAEMREYYALETFYAAAEEVELPFVQERADAAGLQDWRTTS
jgi:ribosomal silencing factor RsfS